VHCVSAPLYIGTIAVCQPGKSQVLSITGFGVEPASLCLVLLVCVHAECVFGLLRDSAADTVTVTRHEMRVNNNARVYLLSSF
jgi:hypothetical protein